MDLEQLLRESSVHRHKVVHRRDAFVSSTLLSKFNSWLAVRITSAVGTMYCAYAFAALAFISLPAAITSGNPVVMVSWLSQTFIQLVLLSIIMVGQSVLAKSSDMRAEADHDTLQLLMKINTQQLAILTELRKLTGDVQTSIK